MARRAHFLKTATLICLLAVWPLVASPGAPTAPPVKERVAVSANAPTEASEPLWRWFREQDKLLDDILTRLARIEGLVGDIHRLVSQMPDRPVAPPSASSPGTQPAIKPSVAPSVAPPAPAPARPKPVRPPLPDFEDEEEEADSLISQWSMPLTGAALLVLVLLWWRKRRPADAEVDTSPADLEPVSEQADQALELAEIMLSMGLGHGAAQTLAEQIRNEPKQALRYWLRLLAIYRKNGQQEEFARSAEELRQHFNVKPEDWHEQPDALRSLEDYPHIATRLTELWGRPACLVYLHNLLADNRGGSRSGFPQSVAEELLLLATMLRDGDIVG